MEKLLKLGDIFRVEEKYFLDRLYRIDFYLKFVKLVFIIMRIKDGNYCKMVYLLVER